MSPHPYLAVVLIGLFGFVVSPASGVPSLFQRFGQAMNLDGLFQQQTNFRKAYDEINEFLTNMVPTDDVDENMKAVRRWIKHFTDDIKDDGSSTLLKALTQVEALSDDDPDLCTLSSHDTLVANSKATRDFLEKLKPKEKPKRRIDKIVYHYALKEAKECEFHYMYEFEAGGLDLTQQSYDRVTSFIGELITSRVDENLVRHLKLSSPAMILEERPFEANGVAERLRFRGKDWVRDGGIAHKWLTEFVTKAEPKKLAYLNKIRPEDPRQKPTIDEPQLNELFNKYLVDPCEDYVEKLHSAFARDLSLVKLNRPTENTDDDLIQEFYKHSSYWHGCDRFLQEKNGLFSNLKRWIMKNGQVMDELEW